MITSDVGNGNGAVTKGFPSAMWNGRLLRRITDTVALGIDLESEGHSIRNVDPAPLDFGRSNTLSKIAVVEIYPPLWPYFAPFLTDYPIFPYGVIGIGQNKNAFTESSGFSSNCNPASACTVSLENTLAVKVAAGVDYFIAPYFSVNAEIGWKLNAGNAHISTTNTEGAITTSRNSFEASTASFLVGMRYFFEKSKSLPPTPVVPPQMEPTIEWHTQSLYPARPVVPPQIEPTIEAIPPPVQIKPKQQALWVTKDILFESNAWSITSEAESSLLEVVAFLESSPQTQIEIAGHTDLHGSKEGNVRIAKKRAEAVEAFLIKAGITNTMRIISYADTRPMSRDDTPEADRTNRRVTIRVSVKE